MTCSQKTKLLIGLTDSMDYLVFDTQVLVTCIHYPH